jgi:hypothetical protein
MVGLNNVDNTSDLNKPVSTAVQSSLDLKANLASPTFTGTVSGSFSGSLAGNATTATNLASGSSGSLPYQTASGTTAMIGIGTIGQVLSVVGGLPTWSSVLATNGFINMITMGSNYAASNTVSFNATVAGINPIERILSATNAGFKHIQQANCGIELDANNSLYNVKKTGTYKIELSLYVRTATAGYDVLTSFRLKGSPTINGFRIANSGITVGAPWYAQTNLNFCIQMDENDYFDFLSTGVGGTYNASLMNGSSICITRIE